MDRVYMWLNSISPYLDSSASTTQRPPTQNPKL